MKKILYVLAAVFTLSLFVNTKTEAAKVWDEAVTIYGAGLEYDGQTRNTVSELLNATDKDKTDYVYGNDTERYIGMRYDDSILFSSIRIIEKTSGGLNIDINESQGRITQISKETYQNALLTAGITDADVTIAAPHDVTGESALTGIYKAYEVQGQPIPEDRTQNAQDELNTITDITEENENKEGYSQEQLNKAITEIKITVINIINEGTDITEDDVRRIVDEKLAENGLQDVVTEDQRERIIVLILNIKDSGVFNGETAQKIIDSGKSFIGDITSSDAYKDAKEKAKELGKDIKDYATSEEGEGIWNSIKSFFQKLVDAIVGLFK
ncbi:DUF1002 domain-containing protein [Phocicoccus pinnipedialis]|uniref:DUF1002 domain-containing protein n=1 Tax=Phocicoccus pinnipedialis TaxID=110845 RepID=A0A6V7RE46_9BACL|nr:DUF1002 domain-containing protein [Jeotgalicoccus pinnipedialis]MBP1939436.1 uncharacterized protein YpuA (DUF1002 family) [Jeotgalicoccus pinnipedialis]CAD2075412.1 putative protein YpuA [Jeotgalicoccus pinnipedialis]